MNIGDYVRTNDGYINKIKKVNLWNVLVDARDLFGEEINIANNEIIKSSSSIIGLIQKGDYINGYKVSFIDEEPVLGKFVQCDYPVQYGSTNHYRFYENDINSIVTKEQFKSMEYKI